MIVELELVIRQKVYTFTVEDENVVSKTLIANLSSDLSFSLAYMYHSLLTKEKWLIGETGLDETRGKMVFFSNFGPKYSFKQKKSNRKVVG